MILRSRLVLPITAPSIEDGAVVISGERIVAVGSWKDLSRHYPGPTTDLGESLLLPGFINAHCHLDYTDFAGHLPPPRSFTEWIQGVLGLKAQWSYSEYAASWLKGARQLLSSGCTTVLDIEAIPELPVEAWLSSPLRVVSALELTGIRSSRTTQSILDEALQRLESWQLPGNRGALAPHAPYSTRLEMLTEVARVARERKILVSLHLAESIEEFDMFRHARGPMFHWLRNQRDMSDCDGSSPVRYVARSGILSPACVLAHVNYLEEGDIALLAAAGVSVVHCPRSHDYFQHAHFPWGALESAGIPVCLGTDSLLSVRREGRGLPTLDLFAELRAASSSQPDLPPERLVEGVTVKGARALQRAGELGELQPDFLADLIVIPFRGPSEHAALSVVQHVGPVTASMIGGQWVLPPPGEGNDPSGVTD